MEITSQVIDNHFRALVILKIGNIFKIQQVKIKNPTKNATGPSKFSFNSQNSSKMNEEQNKNEF